MKPQSKWLRELGHTGNGVFVVDAAQRIIRWNKGAESLLGYPASEVLNRYCYDVIAGRLRSGKQWCCSNCNVLRCVRRGTLLQDFDLLTSTKEGQDIWVNMSIIALQKKDNPLTVPLLRDVTRREKREETLQDILRTLRAHGVLMGEREDERRAVRRGAASTLSSNRWATLTQREREVLELLTRGLSTEAIADRLDISHLTVRKHVQNALRKSGLQSRTQAVSFALRNRLF